MSRQGPKSATSAQALGAGAAPIRAPGIVDELGQAGSKSALARLNEAMAEVRALAIAPLIQRAVDAIRADDHKTATEYALKALEQDDQNGFAWYALGIAREKAGDFASSVKAYESALRLVPDHAEVANDLGRLAFRMGMHAQAEKLFLHFLAKHPDHAEAINNLACAVRAQQRYDEAIEVLKPFLLRFPENAMLWNTMGSIVTEQGDYATGKLFFQEAVQLEPDFFKARYNLGNCLLMLGETQAALDACDAALSEVVAENERQMMHMARATMLAGLGRLGEAWDEYECRMHPDFSEVTYFVMRGPRWAPGMDLKGKTLLVLGEQGLGDEILFANALGDVLRDLGPDGKLMIGVEKRLVELFQRGFPKAEVCAHITGAIGLRPARTLPDSVDVSGVDLWTPMGSLLRAYRRAVEDFPAAPANIAADPARVQAWRRRLAELPGRKVGILWKSNITKDARHRYFAGFDAWEPVLRQPGVTFVNLQYGDCAEELARAKAQFGVEIWQPPGVDLKQDLDEVAALCAAVDLTVGFSNATFNIAAALGGPSWLITIPGSWPRLGLPDRYAWYPQVRVFGLDQFGDWSPVMGRVGAALGEFAREG
ncbi:MAG TPA: tetratricopeptide repeat protein [Phenylobacterium sp.]|uniref:tetratricopeptide repeat protein n=1 Tax=Phenylobacterium sp. TaxID=1871053 RepID=UPI002B47A1FA|nr:tetratricopeptide repeat protein [Phenylobacterium sp.]HKR89502.1 tetratricopeptide repeat protein [Phenylobacterium sp.]